MAIKKGVFVSVVMPCLNEEDGVGQCIREARVGLKSISKLFPKKKKINGEVIVVDNGSTDESKRVVGREVSRSRGRSTVVRLIEEREKGYGITVDRGFREAKGEIVVMGDSDGSYDFREIPKLVKPIVTDGSELVWGSRLAGKMEKGAMPPLHRYLGTPLMTFLANLFFGTRLSDNQSGFRAWKSSAYKKLGLRMKGWEYTGEMLVKAANLKMRITEVPIKFRVREGASKLSPLKAAWNNGKLLLLFSPMWMFAVPGMLLLAVGLFFFGATSLAPFRVGRANLNLNTLSVSGMLILLGIQSVILGLSGRLFNQRFFGVEKGDFISKWLSDFGLEDGLKAGMVPIVIGAVLIGWTFFPWLFSGFPQVTELRSVLVGVVFVLIGAQFVFGSFFLSSLKKQ